MMKKWEKWLKDYTLGEGCRTASEFYDDIDRHMQDFSDVSHGQNNKPAHSTLNHFISFMTIFVTMCQLFLAIYESMLALTQFTVFIWLSLLASAVSELFGNVMHAFFQVFCYFEFDTLLSAFFS